MTRPGVERDRQWRDECGVFGIFGHSEAANLTYLGLQSLQHRGQESSGIVSFDGEKLHPEHRMGLVQDGFDEEALAKLEGNSAIGHVRYSTTGSSSIENIQPLYGRYGRGQFALAHNGNLVNAGSLRRELESRGALFRGTSDTEVVLHHAIRSPKEDATERLLDALKLVEGAYSMVALTEDRMLAVRDPHGFRPLALGMLHGHYVVSSETCAFRLIDADLIREVEPGEMIEITEDGLRSFFPFKRPEQPAQCIFEHVYFARPDSVVFGKSVYGVRHEMGRQLSRESGVPADVVVPVPDSGMPAAIGYSEESGIPYQYGLIRSHYVGRTFIEPSDSIRHFGVRLKLSPVHEVIKGKRVVVVDDSIVRGTTSKKLVHLFRAAGATEVHMRISAPPTTNSCFYGVDTPTRGELIASQKSVEDIRDYLGADSLAYLSLEGMKGASGSQSGFCDACFTGDYPVSTADNGDEEEQLDLFEDSAEG